MGLYPPSNWRRIPATTPFAGIIKRPQIVWLLASSPPKTYKNSSKSCFRSCKSCSPPKPAPASRRSGSNPPEVRELLGISPGTLQNLRVNGTLPYTKVGGVVYYQSDDILKMLEENRSK